MHKKIYFGSKPLFLTNEITEEIAPYADDNKTITSRDISQESIRVIIGKIQQPEINAGILFAENPEELFSAVKNEFLLVQAGGGVVYVENKEEILMILRRGKWDLPKGKLDPDEQIEECAIREVNEETGLADLTLKQAVCTTYHTYHQDGNFILKESFWFLMTTPIEHVLTPQIEEDIEKCEWVKLTNLKSYMDNTFPAIIDVVNTTIKILHKK